MRRTKLLLLVASLATLAMLAAAAWDENVQKQWRLLQREYATLLPPEAASEFQVQLRQVVAPQLHIADRCVSCHVGMAQGEAGVAGHAVFGKHPNVVHDPAEYGCTVCHGGQGRATDRADAHGDVPFWPEPMLSRDQSYAGCGTCHTHLSVPNLAELARGRDLFERLDCLACHGMDGRGGTIRPGGAATLAGGDLSRVGAAGWDDRWYEDHRERRATAPEPAWRTSFGVISEADRAALDTYLGSRVGAPGLVEAKSVFHSLGCRGCHKVNGVGGNDGPDLTSEGRKDPGRLDFSHVPGKRHSVAAWIAEHFRDPGRVVPGSQMPVLGLSEAEIESLTFYMLALRTGGFPQALWPKDRIRSERFGEREFRADGATLYGTFCAACHGPEGQGMRYPGMPAFPAVANPDFLAIVPDALVEATVRSGRPGRRMPAWGESDGGLRPDEVKAVAAYLRELGRTPREADPLPARWVEGEPRNGQRLYAANCGSCHGAKGEGAEGPSLSNAVLLDKATDTYLVETIGRGRKGTSMPSFRVGSTTHRQLAEDEIHDVVAFVRQWETRR